MRAHGLTPSPRSTYFTPSAHGGRCSCVGSDAFAALRCLLAEKQLHSLSAPALGTGYARVSRWNVRERDDVTTLRRHVMLGGMRLRGS